MIGLIDFFYIDFTGRMAFYLFFAEPLSDGSAQSLKRVSFKNILTEMWLYIFNKFLF